MKTVVGWIAAAVCLLATSAQAQQLGGDQVSWNRFTPAPRSAFELSVGTGYTQGFGRLSNGTRSTVADIAEEGIGVNFGLAYRINPRWSLGVDSQYQEFRLSTNLEGSSGVRGETAGLGATYHLAPYNVYDPFFSFGTGYRMLWETHVSAPDVMRHGFEFGKFVAGVDLKATPDIALGPVVGADLTYLSFERVAGPNGSVAAGTISGGGISTFLFVGMQGKFDIGGQHEHDRMDDTTYVSRR